MYKKLLGINLCFNSFIPEKIFLTTNISQGTNSQWNRQKKFTAKELCIWFPIILVFLKRPMPGTSTGDPTHVKVMQKRPVGQGKSVLKGPPGSACASTPKPESVCFTILWLSPTPLTFTGGYPRPPFSERNQLRARLNKSPGYNRCVPIQIPQIAF